MKKIAILQSNYIPWKGYFDLIASVDEFILYDDMQYTRRDWRNRNLIKTPRGLQWLTVPVQVKGKYHQRIRDTALEGKEWSAQHWKALLQNYSRAPHFREIAQWLEPLYLAQSDSYLSTLNRRFIEEVCRYLGINTVISNSWDYALTDGKTERLADLCVQAGGTHYISGPAAREYIRPEVFVQRGVQLIWFDYSGYVQYPQLWGDFAHGVTILDLLLNCGNRSSQWMQYVGTTRYEQAGEG
ncbi:MAG: WbqC family protein [Burkholderiaceae bacterium]